MLVLHWHKELETGVALIDEQHKEVFARANTFFIKSKCKQEGEAALECLKFLEQYVLYHFKAEEAYQVESRYPGLRAHQAMHKSLATQVKFFAVKLEASRFAQQDLEEFHHFLDNWVRGHILTDDVEFCRYYHAQATAPQQSAPQGE